MRLQVELVGPDGESKELDEAAERALAFRYTDAVFRDSVPGHVVAQAGSATTGDGSPVPVDKEQEGEATTDKGVEQNSNDE